MNFGEVDARFAFVRRIVANPQDAFVPDQSGIAVVAAAGEFQAAATRLADRAGYK